MSEELERIFVDLVDKSWDRYEEQVRNRYVDDMLVGAVITANVQSGYALIDMNSDGVRHFLRFEELSSQRRLIFQLENKTEDLISARVLGRHARVIVGYGQMVNNFGKIWQALTQEMKSNLLNNEEPGVITFDADTESGYVYAQVPLLLDLDQYFDPDDVYKINYRLLQQHLSAAIHSLSKYLTGRIGG